MKKTLFMLALGLTIATSMVAGTMAVYTHTDTLLANGDSTTVDGYAKKFYVNAETTTNLNNFFLAPGESESWGFAVTNTDTNNNTSEVDTDVIVTVNLGDVANWQDFDVALIQNGVTVGTRNKENNTIQFVVPDAFKAEDPATLAYSLKFTWLDDGAAGQLNDAEDTKLVMDKDGVKPDLPHVTGISVTVTGSQA